MIQYRHTFSWTRESWRVKHNREKQESDSYTLREPRVTVTSVHMQTCASVCTVCHVGDYNGLGCIYRCPSSSRQSIRSP